MIGGAIYTIGMLVGKLAGGLVGQELGGRGGLLVAHRIITRLAKGSPP